jgi:molecular chaperone GrpE
MGETNVKRIEIHGKSETPGDVDEKAIKERSRDDQDLRGLSEIKADLSKSDRRERIVNEAEEWKDKYLRLLAELENMKKRLTKRLEIELEAETSAVLLDLLPVADNLERLLSYVQESEDKELEQGLRITLEGFKESMAKHGVSQIEASGKPFNPEYHEAIGAIPALQFEDGTIIKVEQTGYSLHGKVLRPARVLIAGR